MHTLSVTSTKTMTYCPLAAADGLALIEKLASVAGAGLRGIRKLAFPPAAPALCLAAKPF